MKDEEKFTEFCPIHKTQVVRVQTAIMHSENGDQFVAFKCPYPRCKFRTVKRITKPELIARQKARSDTFRELNEYERQQRRT